MNLARALYVASAVLCPILFCLAGGAGALNSFVVEYHLLPFSAIALAMAVGLDASIAPAHGEVAAGALWCVTYAAAALWFPLFAELTRLGHVIDAIALLIALTAGTLGFVLWGGLSRKFPFEPTPPVAVILRYFGVGVLAAYLLRAAARLYMSTRLTVSGGIAAMSYEAALTVATAIAVSLFLVPAGVLVWFARSRHTGASTLD
jgi:hypothetical protein